MQTPSSAKIQAAIVVLKKLAERLNIRAANSAIESPETSIGTNNAARIKAQAIQQTTQINAVTAQLDNWHAEMMAQSKQCVSHHE